MFLCLVELVFSNSETQQARPFALHAVKSTKAEYLLCELVALKHGSLKSVQPSLYFRVWLPTFYIINPAVIPKFILGPTYINVVTTSSVIYIYIYINIYHLQGMNIITDHVPY